MKLRLDRIREGYVRLTVAVMLNAPLVFLLLLRNARPHDFDIASGTYLAAVSLGYYLLPVYIVASLLYLVVAPLKKLTFLLPGGLLTVAVYYFLLDSYTFGITRMHIDLFWMEWIISDFGAFGLSPTTLRSVFLALLVVIAAEAGIFFLAKRIRIRGYMIIVFWGALIVCFAGSQVVHAVAYEKNDMRITSLTPYLPMYYGVTSHKRSVKYGGLLPIEMEDSNTGEVHSQGLLTYPLKEITQSVPEGAKLPNILVLFFESWRYDMMGEEVTPNVFALSRKSLVAQRHFCSGNSTVAGVFGFFYGLDPTYWSSVKADNAQIDNPVLIDVLRANGYKFGIFAKSNFKRHKIKDAVFRGIEVHKSFEGETVPEQDANMTRQLIDFLREQHSRSAPFLAFAFYKSNHAPYRYPASDTIFRPAGDENLMLADKNTDPTRYLNDYRNATHYVDKLIGKVLGEIDSLGYMSNTIIIVTTDHGEQFNDDHSNYWGHATNFTQYQTMVPLVFYAPGKPAQSVTQTTSHIDVIPTLLQEFLYCTNDVGDYSNGVNLYRAPDSERAFVVGGYVNHAFIVEDNVYEIYPFFTKYYKLDNTKEKASAPSPRMLTSLMAGISRFYAKADADAHAGQAVSNEP